MLTPQEFARLQNEFMGALIDAARGRPDRRFQIRDQQQRVIATVEVHDTPMRPTDMPRHLRPKIKLSKRQRTAAKHETLDRAAGLLE